MSHRYRRSRLGRAFFLLVLVALVVLRWYWTEQPTAPEVLDTGVEYAVERVIDGDTLLLANAARVRLLGIDTPETKKPNHPIEPWGPEATVYTKRFIAEAGGRVRLEFDRERLDQYDRVLAYVYSGDLFLNEALVREGLAVSSGYRISATKRRLLRNAEDEAKAARRGIWSGAMPNH